MKSYSLVWEDAFFDEAVSIFGSIRAWDEISWRYLELIIDPSCYPSLGTECEMHLECYPSAIVTFTVNHETEKIMMLRIRRL